MSPAATNSAAPDSDDDEPQTGTRTTGRKAMLLRLDPIVHEAITRWATDDLRSTNAHVEWLLRRALAQAGRLPKTKGPTLGAVPDTPDNEPA
jgi:hypothetical protein